MAYSVKLRKEANDLREKGQTQREISKTIGVSRRTVQSWSLESAHRSIFCGICGESFMWRATSRNVRSYCYSESCKREKKNRAKRADSKTDKGKAGIKRRERRATEKRRLNRRYTCRACGKEFKPKTTERCCSTICNKHMESQWIDKHREEQNTKAREAYERNPGKMRQRHKDRWLSLPQEKRREISWRKWVRKRFGTPTPMMWKLLKEQRNLKLELEEVGLWPRAEASRKVGRLGGAPRRIAKRAKE